MNSQRLQLLLEEVQINIDAFREGINESKNQYRDSLTLITDPDLRSSLLERHIIEIERQRATLSEMETLFDQVKNQLARPNKSN